jgi:hypothetical protein
MIRTPERENRRLDVDEWLDQERAYTSPEGPTGTLAIALPICGKHIDS